MAKYSACCIILRQCCKTESVARTHTKHLILWYHKAGLSKVSNVHWSIFCSFATDAVLSMTSCDWTQLLSQLLRDLLVHSNLLTIFSIKTEEEREFYHCTELEGVQSNTASLLCQRKWCWHSFASNQPLNVVLDKPEKLLAAVAKGEATCWGTCLYGGKHVKLHGQWKGIVQVALRRRQAGWLYTLYISQAGEVY